MKPRFSNSEVGFCGFEGWHMFLKIALWYIRNRSRAKLGNRYFEKWWKKACENLKIKGVFLYGGTRHSNNLDI